MQRILTTQPILLFEGSQAAHLNEFFQKNSPNLTGHSLCPTFRVLLGEPGGVEVDVVGAAEEAGEQRPVLLADLGRPRGRIHVTANQDMTSWEHC